MTRLAWISGALLLTLAHATPANAAAAPAMLAGSCSGCHGPNGTSKGAIPSIDKLDAESMSSALKAFRSGDLQGTVMNRIAKGYTDDEIAAIAQYFGTRR